jgi:vacuolar iron transporter family protein
VLEEMLAKRNQGRKQPGAWIGDAIYGVNDGLGAIFGIVSGVSGATSGDSKYVLLAGLSGMIASALSMGSGAYLAAKSEREIYHAEIAREREAIQMNGPEARELLSLYYQVKGLPEEDAIHMVNHIASDPEQLLRALSAERLGSSEEALANPLVSASSGALSTAVGAIIPVIPFFFMQGIPAVIAAAVVSLAAHFAVGAAKSLITVRSWWSSGLEMTVVGAVEGAVTYGIGICWARAGCELTRLQAAEIAPIRDIDTARAHPHTLPMNITLSVEDQVAERARQSAAEMGETLEHALEDYVRLLAEKPERVGVASGRRTLREEIYRLG